VARRVPLRRAGAGGCWATRTSAGRRRRCPPR
jgi:hypothetical protein